MVSDGSNASSLAKLPPGDSDEEAELVKLINIKTSSGRETSPTGREHPFSPMVNREMLYGLVRQAFKQSEEQQVNFESGLKREYGRRSKGEVRKSHRMHWSRIESICVGGYIEPQGFIQGATAQDVLE